MAKWLVREDTTIAIAGSTWPANTNIVILNYENVAKFRPEIDVISWDLLIVDECHMIKNPKAQRSKAILGDKKAQPPKLGILAKREIWLTGTPIVNRPIELWPLVERLDPQGLGKYFMGYAKRYCGAFRDAYGWNFTGASNLEELQAKLRGSFMIRRLKSNVLSELPPKRRQVVVIPANGASAAVADEVQLWERSQGRIDELRAAVELAKASSDPEDYARAVSALKAARGVSFEELAKVRHRTAIAKLPYVIEHLHECLEGGNKLVVFCHHLDVADAISNEFKAPKITGEVSMTQRQAAVDLFQNNEDCRLIVCTIRAAGIGLTLTASAHVIFAELDWTPSAISQAEDRTHRIGQTGSVLVQHLVLDGSLDARMAEILIEKQRIIELALNNGDTAEEYKPIAEPEEDTSPEYGAPATTSVTRDALQKVADELGPEEIQLIHTCLIALSGMCDGAASLDGMGFNKVNVAIGKSLAACQRLTPRQAALGRKICVVHRRQLPQAAVERLGLKSQ